MKTTRYILLLIIIVSASYRFYLSSYLPNMGDAALHAWVIEEITDKGELIYTVPYILTNNSKGFPLQYPVFFHLIFSIANITWGYYTILPPIFGIFSVLLIYLITKDMFENEKVGILSAFIAAIHPYHALFTSVIFMESLIVFEILIVIWSYLGYIRTNEKRYIVLIIIFLGISIGTKQIAYIVLIAILAYHFIIFRKKGLKSGMLLLVGSFLVSFPMLMSFYQSFGTFLFPMRGSFLDKLVFSRSQWQVDPIFDEIAQSLPYSHLRRYLTLGDILNFYDPSAYYLPCAQFNVSLFIFMILVGIIGCFYLIFKTEDKQYYQKSIGLIVIVLVFNHITLILLRQPRYFIHSMLLILPFFVYSIIFLKNKKMIHKRIVVVLITTFVIFASIMFAEGYIWNTNRVKTQGWMPSKGSMYDEIEAFNFINSNLSHNDRVLDFACSGYEALYYLKDKEIIAWTPYGGMDVYSAIFSEDSRQIEHIFEGYNIKYIILREKYIVNRHPETITEIPIDTYNFLISSGLFKQAFSRPGIEVWEFVGDTK